MVKAPDTTSRRDKLPGETELRAGSYLDAPGFVVQTGPAAGGSPLLPRKARSFVSTRDFDFMNDQMPPQLTPDELASLVNIAGAQNTADPFGQAVAVGLPVDGP
jgi:hypothetical protein